jgi:hypothetical protein
MSAPCYAQWNPLEGVVYGESALGNAEMGLQPPRQEIPLNGGTVFNPSPAAPAAPVLQQGQVYSTPFVANSNANYTHESIQQMNARLMAGGVGGLNQHPVPPVQPVQPQFHQTYYAAPHPTFVQVPPAVHRR